MKKIYGIFYAMLSSAAFGLMPIFAKIATNNGTSTLTVLSVRFLLAFLMLLIYFLITKTSFRVNKTQFIILSLTGLLGYTSIGLTLFFSYNYIPVGIATTMHFIYPAVVMVLNYMIYKGAVTKYKAIALALSIIGVYVLVGINAGHIDLFGSVLAILSGFAFAGCVMGMNHPEAKKVDNMVSVFYFSLSAGVLLFLITTFTGNLEFPRNFSGAFSLVGISLVSTIISIGLFIKSLKIIGPTSASILSTFEPIVSIIMGIILFGEKLTLPVIIGTVLILASVVILAKDPKSND